MNFLRIVFILIMISPLTLLSQEEQIKMKWTKLANIPDQIGFAGAYVAMANDYLFVMGGANFPDGRAPWEGGKKVWTNKIFVLKEKDGKWVEGGSLPGRMGYGAVASYKDYLYVAGGSNEGGHLASTYKLVYHADDLLAERLPDLPHPIANCSSVQIANYWYILGGIEKPESKTALNICWRLDLDHTEKGWEVCPSIPGEGRMLSVVGNLDGDLILASGVILREGIRTYLQDAYVFDSSDTWHKIADLPESVAAAPSPTWFDKQSGNLLIFGGDNGELASKDLRERHPGFSNSVLSYNPSEGIWNYGANRIEIVAQDQGDKTWAPVTTGAVFWKGGIILPTGEIRPGIRTPQVLFGILTQE